MEILFSKSCINIKRESNTEEYLPVIPLFKTYLTHITTLLYKNTTYNYTLS